MTPQELQNLLDELEASRASRRRAWENLQEIRWVLKDSVGVDLPPPARKTIDLEGRVVKDGVRKALPDRQLALTELVHAIRHFRQIADSKPLTLQGSDHAHAVQELRNDHLRKENRIKATPAERVAIRLAPCQFNRCQARRPASSRGLAQDA